ncbi:MAG: hypothetical protein AMXMBFR82_05850 [Candidatus Hydrogenedentota bacterium]
MDKTPSSEIQERLRALCRQITVAEEIDPEIQEELMSHVEDRFNGYLHGKDPITEEDAFLLVREHFGNPAVVKELLQHAHVQEATVSLGRRLAAIGIVSLICFGIAKLLHTLFIVMGALGFATAITFPPLGSMYVLLAYVAVACVIWATVVYWRRGLRRGRHFWFSRWSIRRIVFIGFAVALIVHITPDIDYISFAFVSLDNSVTATYSYATRFPRYAGLCLIAQAAAWFWWCDTPPRSRRTLRHTMATWILVTTYSSLSATVAYIPIHTQSDSAIPLRLSAIEFGGWWSGLHTSNVVGVIFLLAYVAVVGILARAAYVYLQRYRRSADSSRATSQ